MRVSEDRFLQVYDCNCNYLQAYRPLLAWSTLLLSQRCTSWALSK